MDLGYEIVEFTRASQWRHWLRTHHRHTKGAWLRLYKKASGVTSVSYDEALDIALCYGWIDGQARKHDALSYLQKFTPRRARSMWSARNICNVKRLIEAGLMKTAGLAEVERAKADGRWNAAYDSPRQMVVPQDFMDAISDNKRAWAHLRTLNKSLRFIIGMRLQTARTPETRARRLARLIAQLEEGENPR
jgi:uncharacterized protein YdeI (YjbR/CyaY-like superfamily)